VRIWQSSVKYYVLRKWGVRYTPAHRQRASHACSISEEKSLSQWKNASYLHLDYFKTKQKKSHTVCRKVVRNAILSMTDLRKQESVNLLLSSGSFTKGRSACVERWGNESGVWRLFNSLPYAHKVLFSQESLTISRLHLGLP